MRVLDRLKPGLHTWNEVRLLTLAATRFLDRRLRCIGAIKPGGVCGDGFGELPRSGGVGDIRRYVFPSCQDEGGLGLQHFCSSVRTGRMKYGFARKIENR